MQQVPPQQQQPLRPEALLHQLQEVQQAKASLRHLLNQLEQLEQSLQQQLTSFHQQQHQLQQNQQVFARLGQLAELLASTQSNPLAILQQQGFATTGNVSPSTQAVAVRASEQQRAARGVEQQQGGDNEGSGSLNYELKQEDEDMYEESLPEGSYDVVEPDAIEVMAEHTHFCEICHKGFKRDANLRMHMRGHGDEYKTAAALQKPGKDLQEPPDSRPKRYSCPHVGCKRNRKHPKFQPLKTMLCVKNHYRRSHCPKVLCCSKCGQKKFSVVADLKTHEKHCGRDKWMCSCRTTFSRKDKLLGHLALFAGHTPLLPLHMMENAPAASASGGPSASAQAFANSSQLPSPSLQQQDTSPRDFQTNNFFSTHSTENFLSKNDSSASALQSLYRELSLPLDNNGQQAGSSQLHNLLD